MERRFYIGIGILLAMLLLGLFVGWGISRSQEPTAQALEKASQVTDSGDFDTGIRLAKEAKSAWQAGWRGVAAIADHTPMDEIDSLFEEMEVYIRTGEDVHFSACCAQLSSMIRAVSDAHQLNWWNLL